MRQSPAAMSTRLTTSAGVSITAAKMRRAFFKVPKYPSRVCKHTLWGIATILSTAWIALAHDRDMVWAPPGRTPISAQKRGSRWKYFIQFGLILQWDLFFLPRQSRV